MKTKIKPTTKYDYLCLDMNFYFEKLLNQNEHNYARKDLVRAKNKIYSKLCEIYETIEISKYSEDMPNDKKVKEIMLIDRIGKKKPKYNTQLNSIGNKLSTAGRGFKKSQLESKKGTYIKLG